METLEVLEERYRLAPPPRTVPAEQRVAAPSRALPEAARPPPASPASEAGVRGRDKPYRCPGCGEKFAGRNSEKLVP
jgi:hypothetical protein